MGVWMRWKLRMFKIGLFLSTLLDLFMTNPVIKFNVHNGMGSDCYSKYSKIYPYPAAQGKSLSECQTMCTNNPECGAILMLKGSVESGGSTSCYMVKPNNLFIEGTCTWGSGTYNAYEKKFTVLIYKVYKAMESSCYSKYTKISPYPAASSKRLSECQTICSDEPKCGAIVMWKSSVESGGTTYCYMIKPNNLFNEGTCTWGNGNYNAYEKKVTVLTFKIHRSMGSDCYSKYSKIHPYPAAGRKSLSECQTMCTIEPECGAVVMAKGSVEGGNTASCYMVKPNNLFSECTCTWGSGTYNAYEKEFTVCTADAINEANCFCKSATSGAGEACTPEQKCNGDGTCQDGRTITFDVCVADAVNSAICFCEGQTSGSGEACISEQICNTDGTCNDGCLAVETTFVTKDELKFSSPGYPETGYENNREYCWRFKAEDEDDKLSISITTILTEYGYDVLTIYESGESENKESVLLSVSGNIPPGNIISNKNEIKIIFKTDVYKNMRGFEASVMAVKKKDLQHCLAVEATNVTKDEFKFSSPGYPETGYENNREYCWRFKAKDEDDKLSISITTILTEYGYDVLTIYEKGESENKERVLLSASGDIPPGNIISNKNEIKIIFKTDVNKNMMGFEASVMAVKKKDLPHFSWEDFWNGKIGITFQKESSNPVDEVIEMKLAPHYEEACIFIGSTKNTNLTVASPYSGSNCQTLSQHAQISMSSVYLTQRRATFAIKNGILHETTEDFFIDNTFDNNVDNPVMGRLRQQQSPSHIEIRINLAYDRSILEKFKNFGSKDREIKKQLRQLFYFAKRHLEEQSGNTKIEILLNKNIILIDETLSVNQSSLQYIRQFQTSDTEPLIVVCGDFDEFKVDNEEEDYVNGLAYRSGACRPDSERYGVALVAWREDLVFTGDVFAHEIEHIFGMTHHGHTHHDLTSWFTKQGFRCYTEICPSPPFRDNGYWSCTKNNKTCHLKCSPGFTTVTSIIQCENGQFSSNVDIIGCSPSVFLIIGNSVSLVEVYHPTDAKGRNNSCSNLPSPPPLDGGWYYQHGSVLYEGVLISCRGLNRLCHSLNMEDEDPQWELHQIPYIVLGPFPVISDTILYLFSRGYNKVSNSYDPLIHTTLPLQGIPQFTYDYNLEYNAAYHCITQIDEDRVALMGGYLYETGEQLNNVTIYNLKQQTSTNLSPMITPRSDHACIKVDIDGKPWLVVSGGNTYKTERLNLEGSNKWEAMGDLNKGRYDHQMVWTAKDTIIALGGSDTKSIEVLVWGTKTWNLQDESLANSYRSTSIVEIPASLLGCQMNEATVCPDLPQINHGTWNCNAAQNKCVIQCDIGYISLFKQTTCFGGTWLNVNKIQCEPSIWLGFYGYTNSFYHPTIGNPTCSKPPPNTVFNWWFHTVFAYENRVYICGGLNSDFLCVSLNLESDEFQWKTHTMNISRDHHTYVILENKLYFIGGFFDKKPISTSLPIAEEVNFFPVPNLTHEDQDEHQCVVKLNEHSFITLWSDGNVSKYDAMQQTETQLAQLSPPRNGHACLMVTESGNKWIVVSGGRIGSDNYLSTTERLDLSTDAATWENMEAPLNSPRYRHKMIMTDRGIMALGGYGDYYRLYTVEVLNWTTKTWNYTEPSLADEINSNEIVEVPASTFGCQAIAIDITGCKGEYVYNQEYVGGNVKQLGNGETCHSVCVEEADCKAWTWNSEDRECRLQTSVGTPQFKNGSVSGLQGSCKPKCFLLLKNQNASISTHLCDNKTATPGSEEECQPMIQMVPDELEEDNTILICYKIEGKSFCEEIAYSDVKLLCNDEPSIVTLTTIKHINKHRYYGHLKPYFGYYG